MTTYANPLPYIFKANFLKMDFSLFYIGHFLPAHKQLDFNLLCTARVRPPTSHCFNGSSRGALLTALLAYFIIRMHHRRDHGASESEIEKQVKTLGKRRIHRKQSWLSTMEQKHCQLLHTEHLNDHNYSMKDTCFNACKHTAHMPLCSTCTALPLILQ